MNPKVISLIKDFFIMTIAMLISAAAVYYFLLPSKLVVGSISGFSIVLIGIFEQLGMKVSLSVVVFVINAILLVLAYFLVNKEFGAKTVYTALILGPMISFWEKVCPWENLATMNSATGYCSVMADPWLDLCCFVLILSAAQAILFNINASTGGLDILAKIVNKYFHFDIGMSVTISGAIICCTALAINPFRLVIIGLLGTWINGVVVNYFTATINNKKRVCIITDDYEKLRCFIINELSRGCSIYDVTGGYTNKPSKEIQTLITQTEFSDLMKFIKQNDIKAFSTAGNVSEIYGEWSRHRNRRQNPKS